MVAQRTTKAVVKSEAIAATPPSTSPSTPSTSAPSTTAPNGATKALFALMDVFESVYLTGQKTGDIYRAEGVRPAVVHAVASATGGVVDLGKHVSASAPGLAQTAKDNAPAVVAKAGEVAARTVDLTKAAKDKATSLLAGR
jgi:hypothetical protein